MIRWDKLLILGLLRSKLCFSELTNAEFKWKMTAVDFIWTSSISCNFVYWTSADISKADPWVINQMPVKLRIKLSFGFIQGRWTLHSVRDGFEDSVLLAVTPFKRMWTRTGAMNWLKPLLVMKDCHFGRKLKALERREQSNELSVRESFYLFSNFTQ